LKIVIILFSEAVLFTAELSEKKFVFLSLYKTSLSTHIYAASYFYTNLENIFKLKKYSRLKVQDILYQKDVFISHFMN